MIQPIDIKTQSFKKGLFGYKASDVDSFVDTVYRSYDEAFNDNAKLKEEVDRLKKVIEENNLKIFELEKKVGGDDKAGKSDKKGSKKDNAEDKGKDDKSATSKFFKKAEETTVIGGDDDEVFTGDVEEARKPNKAMIGDGEEEGGDDFTFL